MENIKEYSNGEVTIVWKPKSCIHSGICVRGLGEVFKPKEKPWIKIDAASTDELINQVSACPSGALSYYLNGEKNQETEQIGTQIEILKDGPILVHGDIQLTHYDGKQEFQKNTTAFCRCGVSKNKPFCDGSHVKQGFKD